MINFKVVHKKKLKAESIYDQNLGEPVIQKNIASVVIMKGKLKLKQ